MKNLSKTRPYPILRVTFGKSFFYEKIRDFLCFNFIANQLWWHKL